MKINLYDKYKLDKDIKVGDVIVYYNPKNDDYDYFMIMEIFGAQYPFRLLRLKDCVIIDKHYEFLYDLIEYAKKPVNNYHLYEIIPSEELELNRNISRT